MQYVLLGVWCGGGFVIFGTTPYVRTLIRRSYERPACVGDEMSKRIRNIELVLVTNNRQCASILQELGNTQANTIH